MKNRLNLINLYDLYGELLTEKQQNYFEDYYFSNLSLSEIAENMDISRNAVYKQIKDAEANLLYYENHLHLLDRNMKIKKLIVNLETKIKNQIEKLL